MHFLRPCQWQVRLLCFTVLPSLHCGWQSQLGHAGSPGDKPAGYPWFLLDGTQGWTCQAYGAMKNSMTSVALPLCLSRTHLNSFSVLLQHAPAVAQGGFQSEVLDKVNTLRRARGLPALQLSGPMNAAAARHSYDMSGKRSMTHTGAWAGDNCLVVCQSDDNITSRHPWFLVLHSGRTGTPCLRTHTRACSSGHCAGLPCHFPAPQSNPHTLALPARLPGVTCCCCRQRRLPVFRPAARRRRRRLQVQRRERGRDIRQWQRGVGG